MSIIVCHVLLTIITAQITVTTTSATFRGRSRNPVKSKNDHLMTTIYYFLGRAPRRTRILKSRTKYFRRALVFM